MQSTILNASAIQALQSLACIQLNNVYAVDCHQCLMPYSAGIAPCVIHKHNKGCTQSYSHYALCLLISVLAFKAVQSR